MGHSKYRFLIPGKPSSFLTPEWFIFAGSATTLSVHPPPRTPVPTLVQLPGPRTRSPLQHEALATCLRPVAAGAEPAGLVLLRRRARKLRPAGRGGAGKGSGREMHLLNKRRPRQPQGRAGQGSLGSCPRVLRLREVAAQRPARGWEMRPLLRLALLQPGCPGQHCHMPVTQTPVEKEQPPHGGGGGSQKNPGWSRDCSMHTLACSHHGGGARARHCNFISFLALPATALPKSPSPPDSRNWEAA